jgi:hypothetical protein
MTDDELTASCKALEPAPAAQVRMERRVMDWLDAERTPLRDEWLAMLRTAPVQGLSFSFAGAAALLFTTPLLSILQLLN